MSGFKWNKKREQAAFWLAQGHTIIETAQQTGITERTLYRWKTDIEFAQEVDRLTLMVDISSRAERMRIAMRAVRQSIDADGKIKTKEDLLDWLKFAQSETDGIKLDLATLAAAYTSVAGGGSGGAGKTEPGN